MEVNENFFSMVEVDDMTGAGLKNKMKEVLVELGVTYENLVALGFDGAAAMSGHMSGAQTLFKKDLPYVQYVHCFSHRLNLVLSHSIKFSPILNCHTVVSSIIEFFLSSPKRTHTLSEMLTTVPIKDLTSSNLIMLCQTRWVSLAHNFYYFYKLCGSKQLIIQIRFQIQRNQCCGSGLI